MKEEVEQRRTITEEKRGGKEKEGDWEERRTKEEVIW